VFAAACRRDVTGVFALLAADIRRVHAGSIWSVNVSISHVNESEHGRVTGYGTHSRRPRSAFHFATALI